MEGAVALRVEPRPLPAPPRGLRQRPGTHPALALQVGGGRGRRQPQGLQGQGAPARGQPRGVLPLRGRLHARRPRRARLGRRPAGPRGGGRRGAGRLAGHPPRRERRLRGLRPDAPGRLRLPHRGLGAGRGHRRARADRRRQLLRAAPDHAVPRAAAPAGLRSAPGGLGGAPALLPGDPPQPQGPHLPGLPPGVPGPRGAGGPGPGDPAPSPVLAGPGRVRLRAAVGPARHEPGAARGGAGRPR